MSDSNESLREDCDWHINASALLTFMLIASGAVTIAISMSEAPKLAGVFGAVQLLVAIGVTTAKVLRDRRIARRP